MATISFRALVRTAVGLLQGIALYLLYHASEAKTWPATDGVVFSAILMVAIFAPTLLVAGLGNLRARSLVIWTLAAVALCAALGFYDISRSPLSYPGTASRIVPGPGLWLALAAMLFTVHAMTVAGDAERKFFASYSKYIEVAWKHGVQAALAALFVGIFWGLLWLGAGLFELIGLKFLTELIRRPWFWIPVTALAVAYAIHATDVRAGLVSGARTLKLIMLSWLLPLFLPMMTAFAIIFIAALPFTGPAPLWNTRHATLTLLVFIAALVFLINAAYQDSSADTPLAPVVRLSRWGAAVIITPLLVLAAYGLMLRVQQYGWTPSRIFTLAWVFIAACYAAGYLLAAARSWLTLKELELTNVTTACIIIAILLALFSPIADPARISVADQIQRLMSGRISPDKFDYVFLRVGAGRYGMAALERLANVTQGRAAADIAERAKLTLASKNVLEMREIARRTTPELREPNITVIHPRGQRLPDSFLSQDWRTFPRRDLPRCLLANAKCDAILADLDQDGTPEILLFTNPNGEAAAFKADNDGRWSLLGSVSNVFCPGVREALKAGHFEVILPALKEIEVDGVRLQVNARCKGTANR